MTDDGSILMNAFRMIMWMFVRMSLYVCDLCYQLVQEMFGISLDKFPWIWTWLTVLSALLIFFVAVRLVVLLIRAQFDDQSVEMLSGVDLLRRITVMFVILAMIPGTLKALSRVSSSLATTFPSLVSGSSNPSSILLEMSSLDFTQAGQKAASVITIQDITDINAMDGDTYVYFPDTGNMIVVLFASVVALYLYVMICIQIASRIIGLLLKICIAPFAVSALVDPKDNAFQTWVKLCAADFLVTFYQSVLLVLVMTAIASIDVSTLAKVLFMIGALMAVLNAPQGISSLLGEDVGAASGMQAIQSAMTMGYAMTSAGRVAAGGAKLAWKGATGAFNGTTYLAGRMLGGKTFNPDKVADAAAAAGGGGGGGGGIPSVGDTQSGYESPVPGSGYVDNQNRVNYSNGINTRENTFANRVGRAAERAHGFGGAAARAILKVSSKTYQHAGQKLYQNKYNPWTGKVGPSKMKQLSDLNRSARRYIRYVRGPIA